ncbi:hypothetical protein ACHEMB_RS21180 [Escherichia coli]
MLLGNLFYIRNGISMSGMKVCHCSFPDSVPVLRPASTQERTIAGWINRASVDECNIYPAGALFVSTNGEGSHSYSYVSSFEFVCNSDISVLIPKKDMGLFEKNILLSLYNYEQIFIFLWSQTQREKTKTH